MFALPHRIQQTVVYLCTSETHRGVPRHCALLKYSGISRRGTQPIPLPQWVALLVVRSQCVTPQHDKNLKPQRDKKPQIVVVCVCRERSMTQCVTLCGML